MFVAGGRQLTEGRAAMSFLARASPWLPVGFAETSSGVAVGVVSRSRILCSLKPVVAGEARSPG